MARRGDRVQLEESHNVQALSIAKMANGGYSHATIEEVQYLSKKYRNRVWEGRRQDIEFPVYRKVKVAIEKQMAMVRQYCTEDYILYPNGATKYPDTLEVQSYGCTSTKPIPTGDNRTEAN